MSTNSENRPLNDFSFDRSESDSYKTCPSSITKSVEKQSDQTSPNENIFLIRQYERGVSLPVTMKIDCDDIAFRLSASSPIDTQLYPTNQSDFSPSPSAHSEPILLLKAGSISPASSLSLTDDQPKIPSWLNKINTITTTMEGTDRRMFFLY
jgi:hypothetical protein